MSQFVYTLAHFPLIFFFLLAIGFCRRLGGWVAGVRGHDCCRGVPLSCETTISNSLSIRSKGFMLELHCAAFTHVLTRSLGLGRWAGRARRGEGK